MNPIGCNNLRGKCHNILIRIATTKIMSDAATGICRLHILYIKRKTPQYLYNMRIHIFIFTTFGLFLATFFVIICPAWFKMTDYDNLFGSKVMVRKGLWFRCVRLEPGAHECDAYMLPIQSMPPWLLCSRSVKVKYFIYTNVPLMFTAPNVYKCP